MSQGLRLRRGRHHRRLDDLDERPDGPQGAAPAGLVLVCGLLGNITDADVERVLDHCTQPCRTGGTVVWTRNRKDPGLVPQVCGRLEERGFERVWVSEPGLVQAVGAHRRSGEPHRLPPGERMFDFIGYDALRRG